MAYNPFGRLIKVTSAANWATATAENSGNLVFGSWADGDVTVYKIWANGIEYNIVDPTDLNKIIEEIQQHLEDLDSSVDRLDTSVSGLEDWKKALKLAAADNKISIEGVDGSVAVAGSDYVAVSTANDTITVSIDASIKHADDEEAAKALLATQGYVDQEVEKAAGDVEDLSTYVHESVDASIDALQADMADASSRIKKAITEVAIAATVADETATVTLSGKKEDGTALTDDSFTLTGDDYVKVGGAADALTLTAQVSDDKEGIADASSNNQALATDYAVKSYVEDKIKNITGAFVYRGTVAKEGDLPTAAKAGDVYVASAEFTMADGRTVENGDMLFYNGEKWEIVERNLTGAVTAAAELVNDKIVLGSGDGKQEVATSEYGIGADSSHAGAEKTVAAEKWVENRIELAQGELEDEIDALEDRIDGISLSANSSTASYLEIKASEDPADKFAVQAGVVVVDLADATAKGDGLADAYDVKQAIEAAGGSLTAKDSATANAAEIDLTAAAEGSEVGGLGKVTIKGVDDYVKVEGKTNEIDVSVLAIKLADASKGAAGLAIASDVYKELTDVEETMSDSIAAIKESVGLEEDLSIKWTEGSGVAEDATVKEAIEALAGKTGTVVNSFGGKTGAISIQGSETNGDVNLVMDGSTLKANVVNLDKVISEAIDASIDALDVEDASVAGKFVVKVSEEDGLISVARAGLKVNDVVAESDADGNVVVTIDSDDILVGAATGEAFDASTVTEALVYLQDEIEALGGDAVKSVTGDEVDPATPAQFVGVKATDVDGDVTLDSSVLVAADVELSEGLTTTKATASGLATDKYVADYVTEALAWEVL